MITSGRLIELCKVIASAAITWLFYREGFRFQAGELSTLAGAVAGCAGTILGFLITAIALMASVMDRDLLKNLRTTGGYSSLIGGSFLCASLYLLLLAFSVCLLLPWGGGTELLLHVTVFVGALASIQLASTGLGFYRIIMAISKT